MDRDDFIPLWFMRGHANMCVRGIRDWCKSTGKYDFKKLVKDKGLPLNVAIELGKFDERLKKLAYDWQYFCRGE